MPRQPEATRRRVVAGLAAAGLLVAGGLPALAQGNQTFPKLEWNLTAIVRLPEVHERLQAMAVAPNGEPAWPLAQRVAAEMRWTAIASSANGKLH